MTLVCYFYKNHPGHGRPSARGEHRDMVVEVVVVARNAGFSLKHWWKEQQKTKINICRVDENSLGFQDTCLGEFGCFSSLLFSTLGALYLLPESLIHCAYSRALYHTDWKQRESSRGESHAIWHPPHGSAPTSHGELSWLEWPFLLYLISTTVHVGFSMCVWGWGGVGWGIDALVFKLLLRLPEADKWRVVSPLTPQDPLLPLASFTAVCWCKDFITAL